MSINDGNQSCVLCHAYLFEEDDVVYCPECGAPHHRECYNKIGRCALEELHGTENQYDKLKRAAQEQETEKEREESKKAQENFETPFGTITQIDFLGGVKPEEEIDDGVTASEAAKFVLSNTMRYIPKFKKLNKYSKASWNFLAFLFPSGWFLSRKMYLNGIIAAVIQVVSTLLTVPFQNTLYNLGIDPTVMTAEAMQKMTESIDKIPQSILYIAFLGSGIFIALRILSAIFGDWLYKKHTVSSIRGINQSAEEKEAQFRQKGGVNIFLFLLGAMAVQYIPLIIVSFLG